MSDKAHARRNYTHEAMTAAEAMDRVIDLGVAIDKYPLRIDAIGVGHEVTLPVEALAAIWADGHDKGLHDAG